MHKSGSGYRDLLEKHYHFPKMYLSRAEPSVGDWIVYYRPGKGKLDRVYTAVAEVASITVDPESEKHFYANLRSGSYLAFDHPVPIKTDGVYANRLIQRPDGKPNGLAQAAIHPINDLDFWMILDRGFDDVTDDELPRVTDNVSTDVDLVVSENLQTEYIVPTPVVRLKQRSIEKFDPECFVARLLGHMIRLAPLQDFVSSMVEEERRLKPLIFSLLRLTDRMLLVMDWLCPEQRTGCLIEVC